MRWGDNGVWTIIGVIVLILLAAYLFQHLHV